jgi:hypothetical protein
LFILDESLSVKDDESGNLCQWYNWLH